MTENEFWIYLNKERDKGMAEVVSGSFGNTGTLQKTGISAVDYITGHSLLPANYENLPQDKIICMGKLLFNKGTRLKTKEVILIMLAHQCTKDALFFLEEYNKDPDEELKIFAELALDECIFWNED